MFDIQITTPEATVYEGQAKSLVAPGKKGSFGVLTGHAPLISSLEEGPLRLDLTDGTKRMKLGGGFLQVKGGKVIILADSVEDL